MSWIIYNNVLTYVADNNEKIIPDAGNIYAACISQTIVNNTLPYELIRRDLPDIRFSRIAQEVRIRLEMSSKRISVCLYMLRKGKEVSILPVDGTLANHIIDENTWLYFNENFEKVKELLEKARIEKDMTLSFSDYVHFLDLKHEYSFLSITDTVKESLTTDEVLIRTAKIPASLQANLYSYQEIGYKWLKYITDENCGCILGDEMGLGKTLQVITLLLERKGQAASPSLVVAPVSLLENWRREISRFAPALTIVVHHGSHRTGRYSDLCDVDVVITAYSTVSSDLSMLCMINWDIIVLDEAQNIKNPNADRTICIKKMPRRVGIAVTGTPFENHISDLWSLLDFSLPGCLGTVQQFQQEYSDDIYGAERIEPLLTALMLRRKVAEVANDLPEKIIIPQALVMTEQEALLYDDERQRILSQCGSQNATFATLVKLRQYCTHPALLNNEYANKDLTKYSTKYMRLCEILTEIIEEHEKVILFTSFTGMFDLLQRDVDERFDIPVYTINGETPVDQRQLIVDEFSACYGSALLVLNPKAAGVGLNITAANHVIHYNLEWNPALEDQATARAFRRGQDKTVFVYRLYYVDTVEQVVNEKIENKRVLSEIAVVGNDGIKGDREMILDALSKSPLHKEGMV